MASACTSSEQSAVDSFDPANLPVLPIEHLVEFGGDADDEDPVLNRVTDAVVLDAGEVAIASDEGEILVFGTSGDFRRRLGRQGEGPGEFRFIERIASIDGKRIMAWDPALDRVTVLEQDGRLDYTCSPEWARSIQAGVVFVGAFGDGRFVLADMSRRTPSGAAPDGSFRDTIPYHLFDESGNLVRTIGQFQRPPRLYDPESGYARYLFDTSVRAQVVGDEVVVGETNALLLQRFDSLGNVRSMLSVNRASRQVTELDIEEGWRAWEELMLVQQNQMIAQLAATMGEGAAAAMQQQAREMIEREQATIEPAEFLPAFKSILVGNDRTIWIEDHLRPIEKASRWIRMDDGFDPVAVVELPAKERLLAAGAGTLVVLRKDELDIESVVIYGFE